MALRALPASCFQVTSMPCEVASKLQTSGQPGAKFCTRFCTKFCTKEDKAWKEVAGHPPLSAGQADLAGAAQAREEHLLLQRNASAVGQHHTTFKFARMSVYMWSQNVLRLDMSLLPRSLWPAGRGRAGKEETAALAAAQVEAWLEGLQSQLALAVLLVISRMLCQLLFWEQCCRLCLTSAEDNNRHGKKWLYTHCFQQ